MTAPDKAGPLLTTKLYIPKLRRGQVARPGLIERMNRDRLRGFSAITAAILVGTALVILAHASAIGWPAFATGLLIPAAWAIAVFLAWNTLGDGSLS